MMKISLGLLALLLVAIASFTIYVSSNDQPLFALSGDAPKNIGLNNGKLAPCLTTPNCVSSGAVGDPQHYIEPIKYESSSSEAYAKIQKIIELQKRTKIITQAENYIYAQSTSRLMGFIDDVEFYINPETKLIDVRSASRLGESDLGVNRKRIEQIRADFS